MYFLSLIRDSDIRVVISYVLTTYTNFQESLVTVKEKVFLVLVGVTFSLFPGSGRVPWPKVS